MTYWKWILILSFHSKSLALSEKLHELFPNDQIMMKLGAFLHNPEYIRCLLPESSQLILTKFLTQTFENVERPRGGNCCSKSNKYFRHMTLYSKINWLDKTSVFAVFLVIFNALNIHDNFAIIFLEYAWSWQIWKQFFQ